MNREECGGSTDLTAGTVLEFAVVTEEAVNNLIQNIPHLS
jgi:hypothetical protein